MNTFAGMRERGLTLPEMLDISARGETPRMTADMLCAEAAAELRRRDAALEAAIESAIRRDAYACANALKSLRKREASDG